MEIDENPLKNYVKKKGEFEKKNVTRNFLNLILILLKKQTLSPKFEFENIVYVPRY